MSSSILRHRTRVNSFAEDEALKVGTGTRKRRSTGQIIKVSTFKVIPSQVGRQTKAIDRCTDEAHPGPPWKSGGPLAIWKGEDGGLTIQDSVYWSGGNSRYEYIYEGGFICYLYRMLGDFLIPDFEWSQITDQESELSWGDESDWGATAWNRFKPGKPGASLAVTVAEAAEMSQMLKTTALVFRNVWRGLRSSSGRGLSKEAANQHLNTQFGWIPFVNDCRSLYDTYQNADKMLAQLIRDNNKWIYRRGTLVDEKQTPIDTVEHSHTAHWPTLGPDYGVHDPYGEHHIITYEMRRVWFSARFRYCIPQRKIDSVNWRKDARRRLFGTDITPEVIWELVPFSWLADWFSNAGDVIANMDDGLTENLAAKYAYIMGHNSVRRDVVSTLNAESGTSHATWTYKLERKQRVAANPFGFGLTGADLSTRQLSILGALGLSRLF